MSNYVLENQFLKVTVAGPGAELQSIFDKNKKQEYLWNGDEKYWPRRAPVLFPFVGLLKNRQYVYKDHAYDMTQHGFARDMEFECICQAENTLWFRLKSDDHTLHIYPFEFIFEIGYELTQRSLKVLWKVSNPADDTMYFSIGAHPGFMCPLGENEKQSSYYMDFHTDKDIEYSLIKQDGLVGIYGQVLALDHGTTSIDEHMFDRDALIIENHQTQAVSLLDPEKRPYVTVHFDAPLFGVWSPTGKNAPFVCIEPWYGRCDRVDFDGTLEQREYEQKLEGHQVFERNYVIEIHE